MVEQLSPDADPLLEMRGICKRFGATIALDNVDLSVIAGEIHAVAGENGAGKSTLMKILSGALKPDAGTIRIQGEPFRCESTMQARETGIAMIYQELSLAPHMSVADNILLGREPSIFGLARKREARRKAASTLAMLGHAGLPLDRRAGELPTSLQQIVEIARALAFGCRILIFDEPTSSLTMEDTEKLFDVIRRLRTEGHAIVHISHFLDEIKNLADSITVLRDGRISGTAPLDRLGLGDIVKMMIGEGIDNLYTRSPRHPGEVLMETRELSSRPRPTSVNMTLHRGEVLGIAGLMGAGRSELLRSIFGLMKPVSGSIRVGVHEGCATPHRRWSQGVGFLSEDRKEEGLALGLSIADNITMTDNGRLGRFGFLSPARSAAAASKWIDRLNIRCRAALQTVSDLSGGNQQKVALSRLLFHDVDILLLDEPTRGIDIASKAQVYRLIDNLVSLEKDSGKKALVVASNYIPELLGICDKIAVMRRGRLGAFHLAKEVNEHTLMLEATAGEQS